MATPSKKRDVEEMDVQSDEDDLDDYSSSEEEEDSIGDENVQVDFEAVSPDDTDANGIRTLLSQLFLKANINLGQLADTIISQNYVGCVLKQCEVEEDESDDGIEEDPIFGVMTVINLSDKKNLESVKQLKAMLVMQCEKCASDILPVFNEILSDTSEKQVGFLISERFINMPSTVAVPLYESLRKDLLSEKVSKMNYKFDQFILICKTCRPRIEGSKERPIDENEITFLNFEEQVLLKHAIHHFTYSVAKERDTLVDGKWTEEDFESLRTVVLFDAKKTTQIIDDMKEFLGK